MNENLNGKYLEVAKSVKKHWDSIAKPIDSLGLLEDYVVKLCAIAESDAPYVMDKKAVVTLCGDHGVVCEGVTQTDSSVTKVVTDNFAEGASTVNHLAKCAGADVYVFDIGVDCRRYPTKDIVLGKVIDRKIKRGTNNLAETAAMTKEECIEAIQIGEDIVGDLKAKGYKIIATGEMGIGNTTPTSALASYFLNEPPANVTGKGAGLSKQGIDRKIAVVEKAVGRVRKRYGAIKEGGMVVDILAELGGLEIAAMTGVFLGGIKYKLPIVIDGAISAVSALMASRINAKAPYYMLGSHMPEEVAGRLALAEMKLDAIVHGRLCLGEGTGAVTLYPLLDMAMEVYSGMGTFEEYRLDAYHRF